MAGLPDSFDADEHLGALSAVGDPLEQLRAVVDFEAFPPDLERAAPRSDGSKRGRPAYDAVPMFRVLVLQTLSTLSDEQALYQLARPAVVHALRRACAARSGAGRQACPRAGAA
jgi:hypothetical protein